MIWVSHLRRGDIALCAALYLRGSCHLHRLEPQPYEANGVVPLAPQEV